MSGPYAYAAADYWNAGWRGVLLLPPRRKAHPPRGYTGWDGVDPSFPDIMAWAEEQPDGNIGLHLPDGVLGIDVDNYADKIGGDTLARREAQWGALPATWRTTSRDDGISGIRLYRVPVVSGGRSLRWPGKVGPGIETVHRGHRYAVVPPSIHPEGDRAYRWITPDDTVTADAPRIADLPELPWAWVIGLTQGREATTHTGAGMNDEEIAAWLAEHNTGTEPCGPMADAADRIAEAMHDGAHDSLAGLMWMVTLAGRGHEGLYPALHPLREQFVRIAGGRRPGGAPEAEQEWHNSLFGAVDKKVGSGDLPEGEQVDPCMFGVVDVQPSPAVDNVVETFRDDPLNLNEGPNDSGLSETEQAPEPRELTEEEQAELAAQRRANEVEREYQQLAIREEAKRRLQAHNAPSLRRMSAREFREAPRPEALVPAVFYKDSLARIYGAPGCGKSFVALDLAMHVALGRDWRGSQVQRGRAFYVMAEGQAVNVLRTEAWCERNDVDFDDLEGWFDAFPDALSLTESAVEAFVEECRRDQPALVILDTKNAMMVGEENSASDFAVMRRALDAIRKACGACVVLIDHTGYEGTRARGTSAATAGMDTEVFVEKNEDKPPTITAKVTRDKAAEVGSLWAWHLRMAGEAAALVPIEDYDEHASDDMRRDDGPEAWRDTYIPSELIDIEGAGKKSIPDLARLMAYDANQRAGDPAGVGMTRQEAFKALEPLGHDKPTVRRAWSRLIDMGYLEPAEGVKAAHLRHLWAC